jgi:hypothetical protein
MANSQSEETAAFSLLLLAIGEQQEKKAQGIRHKE